MKPLCCVIAQLVLEAGYERFFFLPGGYSTFIDHALLQTGIAAFPMLHEQSALFAAEGAYKYRRTRSVISVTAGPGVTNAFSGLVSGWMEVTPVLVISGSVRTEFRDYDFFDKHRRPSGYQQINSEKIVANAVDFFLRIDPKNGSIISQLESLRSAFKTHGTEWSFWIDVPLDVQQQKIEVADW